jgi:hypothetical protein
MLPEDTQRQMDFIITSLAQITSKVESLVDVQSHAETRIVRLEESVSRLGESQESLHRLVGAIAVAQANTEVNLLKTDERLNNLIAVFERYLGDHRNGKREGEG